MPTRNRLASPSRRGQTRRTTSGSSVETGVVLAYVCHHRMYCMSYCCAVRSHLLDGLYRDGMVHISREMHKQCFITRRETTSGAPKPHRYRSRTFR